MKRYQSKTRLETGLGLGDKDLSENKQLLEDITERFEESKRRSKVDTHKRQYILKTRKKKAQEMRKKKAQEMRKKQWKNLERQKT